MIFGKNILPKEITRWKVTKGSITDSRLELQPGGVAEVVLGREDIPVIPPEMQLLLGATSYTNPHEPGTYFCLVVTGKDSNTHQSITCPIIHSENGFHKNILSLVNMEFESAKVIIRSDEGITINSWHLAGPVGEDTSGVIEEIRGELPRLLHDYNKARFTVKQKETTIALISAFLIRDTGLNGHLQVTYTATEDCALIIRVKDNDVSELFTPILYDVKRGRGSIGIPHAYMEKKIGIHTFTATAQVTNGTLYFETRSILYTIDGGNLAERVMDVGINVEDIILRRRRDEGTPTWIYAVGLDENKLSLKSRPYSDVADTAWEPNFIGEEAIAAAIGIDGNWRMDGYIFRFETEEFPRLFWITPGHTLKTQYYNNVATVRVLAEDVTSLAVVEGYRNINYEDRDQGLLVFYIKHDRRVYYRARVLLFGEYIWEAEREIEEFSGEAVGVKAFRTADYRVGVSVARDDGSTLVLYSTRNWAGIAIAPGKVSVASNITCSLTEVQYHLGRHEEKIAVSATSLDVSLLYASGYNQYMHIENIPDQEGNCGILVTARVLHGMFNVSASEFSLIDEHNTRFNCVDILCISDYEFVLTFIDFNNAEGTLQLVYSNSTSINAAGYMYNSFIGTFVPTDLVPTLIPIPEVEVVWNE